MKQTDKVDRNHPAFRENAKPFYDIARKGLGDEVDGEHFWDTIHKDAIFEFLCFTPGFTPKIEGRKAYMDWFGGYSMDLKSADGLRVYKDTKQGVVVIEYQVHGTAPDGKSDYNNHFCSIVTIKDRQVVYWRDYMDSYTVMSM